MPLAIEIEKFLHGYCQKARFFVAYSGGVDSHVLLHLCASLPAFKDKITAVYVHHGLQAEAEAWGGHCRSIAEALGVGFVLLRVDALAKSGESPEEAARNARYQALQSVVNEGDVVLLAQHQEDQLETVLLQLFRGSGLKGLSGMPGSIAFGQGLLLRPLLDVAKSTINDYAKAHGLQWVEDPSNQSSDYDRNLLRNDIVPLLKQRWPALAKTVSRSARHCAQAQGLVSALAHDLFLTVFNDEDGTLAIAPLQALAVAEQQVVIRHWFSRLGLKMPAHAVVNRLFAEVLAAREGSDPVLAGQGYCLRRYRDKLYFLGQLEPETWLDQRWPKGQASLNLTCRQTLSYSVSSAGILRTQWESAAIEIRSRRGGEKIRLPGREGCHSLKKLFQEAAIPPWERLTIPLVYLDDKLAAVGDLWISAECYSEKNGACIKLSMAKAKC
ncbi:MAG: tRNA lysidine(34) synthetase TilS [Methylovulum sp.]|nr:tRNA lysidine(34) synthetase TilS [Methylovulum sp.]